MLCRTDFLLSGTVRKEGAHLQLEILFQIWPKLKFYMDVAGKSICIIYCAFVIYSESLADSNHDETDDCRVSYPDTLCALSDCTWLRHVDYSGMHQPV